MCSVFGFPAFQNFGWPTAHCHYLSVIPESRSAQEEKFLSLDHTSINHSCPLSSESGLYGKVISFALVLV